MRFSTALCLVICFFARGHAQFSSDPSENALWNSPLTAATVVQNKIQVLTIRESANYDVNCPECGCRQKKFRYGTVVTTYEYDRQGYPVKISQRGIDKNRKYSCSNEYRDGLLIKSVIIPRDVPYTSTVVFTQHYNSDSQRDTSTWWINGQPCNRRIHIFDNSAQTVNTDISSCQNILDFECDYYNKLNTPASAAMDYMPSPSREHLITRDSLSGTTMIYRFNGDGDTISVTKLLNDYKGGREMIFRFFLSRDCDIDRREKIWSQGGKKFHDTYECFSNELVHYRQVIYDLSNGLIERDITYTSRLHRGKNREKVMRRDGYKFSRDHIIEYSYLKFK